MAKKKTAQPNRPVAARRQTNRPAPEQTAPKRPAVNPAMPDEVIDAMEQSLLGMVSELENFAAHMRALDRMRLNKVAIKREGFIQVALQHASLSPMLLPNYIPLEQFGENARRLQRLRSLCECCDQMREILGNLLARTADAAYSNALGFYASVSEAAKRRVGTAETIHQDLKTFFEKEKKANGAPTAKKVERDAEALLRGKRDGKVIIVNERPKAVGGKRAVVDAQYDGEAAFRDTESGADSG